MTTRAAARTSSSNSGRWTIHCQACSPCSGGRVIAEGENSALRPTKRSPPMIQKLVRAGHVIADPSRLSAGGLIENGAVAVEDDRIAAVGSYAELSERYPGVETIGSERHVAIPGLVNTHHHGW